MALYFRTTYKEVLAMNCEMYYDHVTEYTEYIKECQKKQENKPKTK